MDKVSKIEYSSRLAVTLQQHVSTGRTIRLFQTMKSVEKCNNNFSSVQVTVCQLYDALRQHGRVSSIHYANIDHHEIDFVSVEPIRQVFPDKTVSIDGIVHKFDIIDTYVLTKENIRVADSLVPAPDQHAPNNIANILCDDVLRIIFEDPRFDLEQLVEIGNVCERFRSVAGDVFQSKYKGAIDYFGNMKYSAPLWLVHSCLCAFGSRTSSIDLYITWPIIFLWKWLERHSKEIQEIQVSSLLFEQHCELPATEFPNLVNLQLKSMSFRHSKSIEPFFEKNPQLKQLHMTSVVMDCSVEDILRHLPNLQKLNLDGFQCAGNNMEYFAHLQSLKELLLSQDFDGARGILDALNAGNVQLEHLQFFRSDNITNDRINITSLYSKLYRMKSLKRLWI